ALVPFGRRLRCVRDYSGGNTGRAADAHLCVLSDAQPAEQQKLLSEWPLPVPSRWTRLVNEVQTEAELQALRKCVNRGQPFGPESWIDQCVRKLGLESAMRPRGRPKTPH